MAADVGINMRIRVTEFATSLKQAEAGEYQAFLLGWSGRSDPDGNVYAFYKCKAPLDYPGYCNPEVDNLLDQSRIPSDMAQRKAIYEKLAKIILEDAPILYLYHPRMLIAHTTRLEGYRQMADGLVRSGYVPLLEDWRVSFASMIMPAFVLGNAIAAILMRHTRSAMLQVLESDYVRTARAKGLLERSVILKHAMRNALTPVITLGALELGTLLSGAVLTEQIFSIPGFGKLIVDAVFNRDYAVVQGVVLTTATIYITLNLIADIAYILVNPRLRA